jgi:hypothetical protein
MEVLVALVVVQLREVRAVLVLQDKVIAEVLHRVVAEVQVQQVLDLVELVVLVCNRLLLALQYIMRAVAEVQRVQLTKRVV